MDPWRIGGNYDRPIPRRIAEKAGVPRELFGQKKMAMVVEGPSPETPLTAQLRREYLAWLRALGQTKSSGGIEIRLMQSINTMSSRRHLEGYRHIYYFERVISRILRRNWQIPRVGEHLRGALWVYSVNRLADDLTPALEAVG